MGKFDLSKITPIVKRYARPDYELDPLVEDPANQAPPSAAEQKQWMIDWLSNPETQKRLANNLSGGPLNSPNPIVNAAGNWLNQKSAEFALKTAKSNLGTVKEVWPSTPQLRDHLIAAYHGGGTRPDAYTSNDSNIIVMLSKEPGIHIHELTHASGLDNLMGYGLDSRDIPPVNESVLRSLVRTHKVPADIPDYLRQRHEIYPEVMNLRYTNHLRPGQVVTPEMMDSMDMRHNNLKRIFTKEQIRQMLNTLAQNNQQQQQITQA